MCRNGNILPLSFSNQANSLPTRSVNARNVKITSTCNNKNHNTDDNFFAFFSSPYIVTYNESPLRMTTTKQQYAVSESDDKEIISPPHYIQIMIKVVVWEY